MILRRKSLHNCNCPCHQHCSTRCTGSSTLIYFSYTFIRASVSSRLCQYTSRLYRCAQVSPCTLNVSRKMPVRFYDPDNRIIVRHTPLLDDYNIWYIYEHEWILRSPDNQRLLIRHICTWHVSSIQYSRHGSFNSRLESTIPVTKCLKVWFTQFI